MLARNLRRDRDSSVERSARNERANENGRRKLNQKGSTMQTVDTKQSVDHVEEKPAVEKGQDEQERQRLAINPIPRRLPDQSGKAALPNLPLIRIKAKPGKATEPRGQKKREPTAASIKRPRKTWD